MKETVCLQKEVEKYVKENKILKKDFASSIGVSPVMLSHWLKGRVKFSNYTLDKIVDTIGI